MIVRKDERVNSVTNTEKEVTEISRSKQRHVNYIALRDITQVARVAPMILHCKIFRMKDIALQDIVQSIS